MPLKSSAFLAIWHDIDPAFEADWHRWHTFEHMPERVGVPGFRAGRRYMSDHVERLRCFTMYEGSDVFVFNAPGYLERLNNPSRWTTRIAPAFQNFMRGACRVIASAGGDPNCPVLGGAVLVVQLGGAPSGEVFMEARRLTSAIAALDGVVGAHVGLCDRQLTTVETSERKMRTSTREEPFDGVLVIEAYGRAMIAAARPAIDAALADARLGLDVQAAGVYDLAFYIQPGHTR